MGYGRPRCYTGLRGLQNPKNTMFIAALELRKFLQSERTVEERQMKLKELALAWLKRRDNPFPKGTPEGLVMKEIEEEYNNGIDILDPEFFSREDIIVFAREHKIEGDPMVKNYIRRAYV